ncbi:queuosine precursor transporter [Sorangium cellulosum]|uniref:Queuosine precursor transporter n=2 Tax=Sorangium cellulosum TaxID=56 RepID=S4Y158_SORCE|nr:queuosine precursor transporter [Sorangium cellulosum]AGP36653.1 hypothetical protein SCE1572_20435 [Sorangium cellulosum So0157-2]
MPNPSPLRSVDPAEARAASEDLSFHEAILMPGSPSKRAGRDLASAVGPAAIIVISFYIAAQLISQIASLKIGVVFSLAVDMGTFIYPLTFTLRDMVHKTIGKRGAQTLIFCAGGANLLMALYLLWAARVPSDPSWGLGEQYSAILSPVWRIVLASIVAEIVSELLDTEIFHRVREAYLRKPGPRRQWLAVLASNSVSVPVDNLVFCLGAFAFVLPFDVIWQIFAINLATKFAMTLISLPGIYLVPDKKSNDVPEQQA